jgi:hypothetical protein
MNGDDKKFNGLLETMLSGAKSREAVRSALAQLFPKAEKALRTYVPDDSDDRNERKRQRRLSEKDFAAVYFRLDPQPASWSRSEIGTILNSTNPAEALNEVESRVNSAPENDRPRMRRLFLEALDGAFGVRRPFNLDWFKALVDAGPSFIAMGDHTTQFLYTFDNSDRLRWILIHALDGLLPENRAQLMQGIIPEARDISLLCDIFRTIARDLHKQGAKDERQTPSFGDSTESIREALLARVRELARTNQIWSQSQPDRILWFWWGSDRQIEVNEFTDRAMDSGDGLRGLLHVTIGVVRSTEGDYENVNSSSWSKIVDLNKLAERAGTLKSSPDEADQRLAERFLNALDRGRKDPFYG